MRLVNNRNDFINIINDLCEWLKENDPSSFTRYYLEKAKESFSKDCWSSINDFKGVMEFGSTIFHSQEKAKSPTDEKADSSFIDSGKRKSSVSSKEDSDKKTGKLTGKIFLFS